jgi:hypothetical protein
MNIDWKKISFCDYAQLIQTDEMAFRFAAEYGLLDTDKNCEC